MSSCDYCGDDISTLTYECDYCSQTLCRYHRLPEKHDCPRISDARPPTSSSSKSGTKIGRSRGSDSKTGEKFRDPNTDLQELRERAKSEAEGEPYSVAEVQHTVGNTPDSNFDSSPDVAVDGSVKQAKTPREESPSEPPARSIISAQRVGLVLLGLSALVSSYVIFVL